MRYIRKDPEVYALKLKSTDVRIESDYCPVCIPHLEKGMKLPTHQPGAIWVEGSTLKVKMHFGYVTAVPGDYLVLQPDGTFRVQTGKIFESQWQPADNYGKRQRYTEAERGARYPVSPEEAFRPGAVIHKPSAGDEQL